MSETTGNVSAGQKQMTPVIAKMLSRTFRLGMVFTLAQYLVPMFTGEKYYGYHPDDIEHEIRERITSVGSAATKKVGDASKTVVDKTTSKIQSASTWANEKGADVKKKSEELQAKVDRASQQAVPRRSSSGNGGKKHDDDHDGDEDKSIADRTKETLSGARDKIENFTSTLFAKEHELQDSTKKQIGDATTTVKNEAKNAKKSAEDKVRNVESALKKDAANISDTVKKESGTVADWFSGASSSEGHRDGLHGSKVDREFHPYLNESYVTEIPYESPANYDEGDPEKAAVIEEMKRRMDSETTDPAIVKNTTPTGTTRHSVGANMANGALGEGQAERERIRRRK